VVGADISGRTVIGNHNTIGYDAVVGVKCQDMKYKVWFLFYHIGHCISAIESTFVVHFRIQ